MISKPMMGGMAQKSVMPKKTIPTSDGLAALQTRLAGAKKMKAMKPPTSKGRQKQDMSTGTGLMPGKGM